MRAFTLTLAALFAAAAHAQPEEAVINTKRDAAVSYKPVVVKVGGVSVTMPNLAPAGTVKISTDPTKTKTYTGFPNLVPTNLLKKRTESPDGVPTSIVDIATDSTATDVTASPAREQTVETRYSTISGDSASHRSVDTATSASHESTLGTGTHSTSGATNGAVAATPLFSALADLTASSSASAAASSQSSVENIGHKAVSTSLGLGFVVAVLFCGTAVL